MAEQGEQLLCIKFCIKLEHSSVETIQMIQKARGDDATSAEMQYDEMATAMGNWWWAASSWQRARSCIMTCAELFDERANHPGDSAPYSQIWCPATFAFSQN